ncbi:MAG: hypothetical protein R3359_04255 [Marinirhabdus sp.]|nr:hypothetical protein [Marinirhabdus sp.]
MNLNIKSVLAGLLLLATPVVAQDDAIAKDSITYNKTVSFTLGVFQPIAMGDNFISNGASTNVGGRFEFRAHLLQKVNLGIRFDGFGYDVTNTQITGLYDRGTVLSIAFLGGYDIIEKDKITVTAVATFGSTNYNNRQNDEVFRESANTFTIGGEAMYALNRYFNVYGGLEFRSDQLNINGPPQIQSQFNSVQYLAVQAGLRLILWNKEGD